MPFPHYPQVLSQEMQRYNRLLGVIRNSLQNLDKAIAGLQVLSAELERVLKALAVNKVGAWWGGGALTMNSVNHVKYQV